MAVRPLEDRIVVRPIEQDNRTESGLYLPDSAKERPMHGEVIAVGPGRLLESGDRQAPLVQTGDRVVYGKYAGTEIEIKTEKHLILRESELLGLIEG
jgi:chaperonin GroES